MSLVNYNFNASYNATSAIGDNSIATFSANTYEDNRISFTKTIEDLASYIKNKEKVDADEAEFQNKIIEMFN